MATEGWMSPKGDYLKNASPEERERISSLGGRKHLETHGVERMRELGKKGGAKTSSDRAHMAEIGRRGGSASKGKPRRKWVPSE